MVEVNLTEDIKNYLEQGNVFTGNGFVYFIQLDEYYMFDIDNGKWYLSNDFSALPDFIKETLKVDELKDYPTDGSITYNLSITYNNNTIYRRHFVKDKNRNIDGEQMLCEIVIEDIMHYGLDRIEKDFNKINNE